MILTACSIVLILLLTDRLILVTLQRNMDTKYYEKRHTQTVQEANKVIRQHEETVRYVEHRIGRAEEQLHALARSYAPPYILNEVLVTAYSPNDDVSGLNADSTPLTTSTGLTPKWGYVAVNPELIPYGTLMYIPGYGTALAVDTGYALMNRSGIQVDLYMDTHEQAMTWGKQTRNIIILNHFEKELWDGVEFVRETQTNQ